MKKLKGKRGKCNDQQGERCNTEKEHVDVQWHKIRGVFNAVFACDIVAFFAEMYVHESKTQVCDLIVKLRKALASTIRNFGYDDMCHLHESIETASRDGSEEATLLLSECDWFIDAHMLDT